MPLKLVAVPTVKRRSKQAEPEEPEPEPVPEPEPARGGGAQVSHLIQSSFYFLLFHHTFPLFQNF